MGSSRRSPYDNAVVVVPRRLPGRIIWRPNLKAGKRAPIASVKSPAQPESRFPQKPFFTPTFLGMMFAMVVGRRMFGPLPQFIAADLDVPVAVVGQTLTVETILSVLAALLISPLADRIGRRPVILAAIGLHTLGSALIWFFPSLGALFLGSALMGVGNGIFFPQVFATVGDLFERRQRDRMLALLLIVARVAFLVGPLLSGFLAGIFDWSATFAAGSLITALSMVAAWIAVPRLPVRGGSLPAALATVAGAYRHLLSRRVTATVLAANVAFVIGGYGIDVYFGAFAAQTYGLAPGQVGLLLTVGPAVAIVATWLSVRIGPERRAFALVGSGLIVFLPLAILLNFPLVPAFAVAMSAAWSFGLGLRSTSFNAVILDLAPQHRGAITGLSQVSFSGGTMLGSALGGVALATGGYPAVGIFFGACTLLSVGLFAAVRRDINSPAHD